MRLDKKKFKRIIPLYYQKMNYNNSYYKQIEIENDWKKILEENGIIKDTIDNVICLEVI